MMSNYKERLNQTSCKNIYDIIEWCHNSIAREHQKFPWKHPELNHGVNLLASDDALNCYMSAYGDMHVSKCNAAMLNFPFKQIEGSIEIVDWGCGQGIGAGVILDKLHQRDLLHFVKKITLIEPSKNALLRAECNILKITQNNIQVDAVNKFLPTNNKDISTENCVNCLGYNCSTIIHIFSNVLDILNIDIAKIARYVASSHGKHFVLCIGPKNGAAYRIEQFCAAFGNQQYFSNINSVRFGRTSRTGYPFTCMTRCFVYDGYPIDTSKISLQQGYNEDIYDEYDIRLQVQNNLMSKEKAKIANLLQNILAIDDILYIDPIINDVKTDFIIVRPNKGLVIINLFEHNLTNSYTSEDSVNQQVFVSDNGSILQSPLELINHCQTNIKDGIEELLMSTINNIKNLSLIKKVVIFPKNTSQEIESFLHGQNNFTHFYGTEFLNDNRISNLLFNDIKLLYNNPNFDNVVIRKLATIISPSWHSFQEGRIGVEPKGSQKRLAISEHNKHQKISGVAGSGKTLVLVNRAINALNRTGENVLILTYNITLANYIRARLAEVRKDFYWNKIDILPYHQFFRLRASECQLRVKLESYDNISFFENSSRHKRYAAIFIDEVQDFKTEWLRILMSHFLIPNGEFVVFGDPNQNVYKRPLSKDNEIRLGIIGGDWNKQLNTGIRYNNPRLATLANKFKDHFFYNKCLSNINTDNICQNTLNFQVISYLDLRVNYSFDNLVLKITEIINNSFNGDSDFTILGTNCILLRSIDYAYRSRWRRDTEVAFISTEKYERLKRLHNVTDNYHADWKFKRDYDAIDRARKQLFTTYKRCVKLSSIHSFKGWESPSVILILDQDSTGRPLPPEVIYTAITRAKENLYIINIGDEYYADFFNSQDL